MSPDLSATGVAAGRGSSGGGAVPSAPVTITSDCMFGCSVQKIANVPALPNVREYVSPVLRNPESNEPALSVTVWRATPVFTHESVVPTGRVILAGL